MEKVFTIYKSYILFWDGGGVRIKGVKSFANSPIFYVHAKSNEEKVKVVAFLQRKGYVRVGAGEFLDIAARKLITEKAPPVGEKAVKLLLTQRR